MKFKRFSSIVAGITLATFLLIPSAIPITAAPSVTINPTEGPIGTALSFSAGGLTPSTSYNIYFSSQNVDIAGAARRIGVDVTVYERIFRGAISGPTGAISTIDMGLYVPDKLVHGTTSEEVHGGRYYIYVAEAVNGTIHAKTTFYVTGIATASLNPAHGPVGTEVHIEGSGFAPNEALTVAFDTYTLTTTSIVGQAATDETGAWAFNILIPEAAYGEKEVAITGAISEARAAVTFTVTPKITLQPTSGPAGGSINVWVTGFPANSNILVYLDEIIQTTATTSPSGSFPPINAPALQVTIPEDFTPGTTHSIAVRYAADTSIGAEAYFTVTYSPSLELVDEPPDGYHVGDTLTLQGSNFKPGEAVNFTANANPITPTERIRAGADGSFSASFTLAALPRGTYTLTAHGSAGNEATVDFTIKPQIALLPDQGSPGSEVVVTGSGFDRQALIFIFFDDELVTTIPELLQSDLNGSFSAKFTVPALIPAGDYTVSAAAGSIIASTSFTTNAIFDIAPKQGPVGTEVRLTGEGFGAGSAINVYLDNTPIGDHFTASPTGEVDISINIPPAAAGTHTIKVESETVELTRAFNITPAVRLEPEQGAGGVEVAIYGTGFPEGTISITCGSNETTTQADSRGSFSTTITIPAANPGRYTVTAASGSTSATAWYTIVAQLSTEPTTSLSSPLNVAANVTLSGRGFTPGATITILVDGQEGLGTARVDEAGHFEKPIKVPALAAGEHTITITDGEVTLHTPLYIEGTPPPPPTPLSPIQGSKLKNPVTFDWGDVTDPSGVTYELQIATDEDFTNEALTVTGLTESTYTIPEETPLEALPDGGAYYWRVRAVDGAGNTSAWSAPGDFSIDTGFHWPDWAMWVGVGVGVVAAFGLGFWLGKRSSPTWV